MMTRPTQENLALKYSLYIGLGLLLTLIFLSFIYWQERVIYGDAAFQIFSVVNGKTLAIQVERFGAAIVQYIPSVLAKNKVSLDLILKIYSVSFTIYPFLFALIIWKWLKSPRLALLLVLFFGLTQVHTFYWIQSELIQGCLFSILATAVFTYKLRPSWWLFLLWQPIIVLVIYSHPLSIAIFLFLWAWYAYEERVQIDWRYYSIIVSTCLVLYYKYKIASIGGYDNLALGLFEGFEERLPNIFSLTSTKFFLERLQSTYYLLPLILLVNTVLLIRQKDWINIVFMYTAIICWLALILTTYHYSTSQSYLESYFLPLGVFIGLPLINKLFGYGKLWIWPSLILIISCLRIGQIIEVTNKYTIRLDWVKEQVKKTTPFSEDRFYLTLSEAPYFLRPYDWAVSYETLLLTSLEDPTDTKSIYIIPSEEHVDSIKNVMGGIPTSVGFHPYPSVSKAYFDGKREEVPLRHLNEK